MRRRGAQTPVAHLPPPYPLLLVIAGSLCALLLWVAIWEGRHRKRRVAAVISLALAAALAVSASAFAVASYQEYQWTYSYGFVLHANDANPQVLILPIPGDASLLAGLQLVSGHANWSISDTVHGRGLYVEFASSAEVSVVLSAFVPEGPDRNTTLTMANASTPYGPVWNWIFYSGDGATLRFGVSEDWAANGAWIAGGLLNQTLFTGWHAYELGIGFVP